MANRWVFEMVAAWSLVGITACGLSPARNVTDDVWYGPAPAGVFDQQAVEVPFVEIGDGELGSAVSRLKGDAIVLLSAEEAAVYDKSVGRGDARPYLVRALAMNRKNSAFIVELEHSILRVRHGSLGTGLEKVEHVPLLVYLTEKPAHVYVELNVAQ